MRKTILTAMAVPLIVLTANFTALALQPPPNSRNCPVDFADGVAHVKATGITCGAAGDVIHHAMWDWHHTARHAFAVTHGRELYHVTIKTKAGGLLRGDAHGKGKRRVLWDIA